MIFEITGNESILNHGLARKMFCDRKRVFSDLLRWDVTIVNDRFEIDQFDTSSAVYIIVADDLGRHCGSARLLPTTENHILGTIFPNLCDGPVPRAHNFCEITRFCLSPTLTAAQRIVVRKQLVTALAEYGLRTNVAAFTGVAEKFWFDQIVKFGWRCANIGKPAEAKRDLIALRIDLDQQTLRDLENRGMRAEVKWNIDDWKKAA